MVHNEFVKCEICDCLLNLRIQIGNYDIPFHIQCPDCKSVIDGKVKVNPYNLQLNNANSAEFEDIAFSSVELSAEFPTRKIIIKRAKDFEESPFIRNFRFYKDREDAVENIRKAMRFSEFLKEEGLKEFKQNFQLLWNGKNDLLFPRLRESLTNFSYTPIKEIKNKIDAVMAMHQMLITKTGIESIISDDLSDYTKVAELLLYSSNISEITRFIREEDINFDEIEKKSFILIELFSKIYEQLIPVVALKQAQSLENIDRNEFGIMTANFDELSDFYAKSYEWIIDNLSMVVALNNILERNDYNDCINGKKYTDFLSLTKGNQIQQNYISADEPLSRPLISLNNKIRNAIQHFDSEIDYSSQKIVFKDRKRSEELYLIDFAVLCIENFSLMFYLLEIVYTMRKINLMEEGECLSTLANSNFQKASNNHQIINNSKIGRNEKCPCGSGKKYKKCCLITASQK